MPAAPAKVGRLAKIYCKKEGPPEVAAPRIKTASQLERQMQSHLHDPRSTDGVCDETDILSGRRRIYVTGVGIEARIEGHVVVGSVKAGVVEDVENVQLILQLEALVELEQFLHREIPAVLEGCPENISSGRAEAGLKGVACLSAGGGQTARRYAAITWVDQWDAEHIGVEVRFTSVYTRSALRLRLSRRNTGIQRQDRVGDEVIRAVVEPGNRSRKVIDRERLTALKRRNSAERPIVYKVISPSCCPLCMRELIKVMDGKDVSAVEVRRSIAGPWIQRIVSIEKESKAALLIQGM